MWIGHLIGGLIVAVLFGVDAPTVAACIFFSWLPNVDALLVKFAGFDRDFHGGPLHSLLFSTAVGLAVGLFSLRYGMIAFSCMVLHAMSDLPTDMGVELFYPWKKKVSLNLWKDTGFWGLDSVAGYYRQKWALILESLLLVALVLLLYVR